MEKQLQSLVTYSMPWTVPPISANKAGRVCDMSFIPVQPQGLQLLLRARA